MAISGNFVVAPYSTGACPLSITGSNTGVVTFQIVGNGWGTDASWSATPNGVAEPVYWANDWLFEVSGSVAQVNAVLATLVFTAGPNPYTFPGTTRVIDANGTEIETGSITVKVSNGAISTTAINWGSAFPTSFTVLDTGVSVASLPDITDGSVSSYKLSLQITKSDFRHAYARYAAVSGATTLKLVFAGTTLGTASISYTPTDGPYITCQNIAAAINAGTGTHFHAATVVRTTASGQPGIRLNYFNNGQAITDLPGALSDYVWSATDSNNAAVASPMLQSVSTTVYTGSDKPARFYDVLAGGSMGKYATGSNIWSIYANKETLNHLIKRLRVASNPTNGRLISGTLEVKVTDGYDGNLTATAPMFNNDIRLSNTSGTVSGDMSGVAAFAFTGGPASTVYSMSAVVTSANITLVPNSGGSWNATTKTLSLTGNRAAIAAAAASIGVVGGAASSINDTITITITSSDNTVSRTASCSIAFVNTPTTPVISGNAATYNWNKGEAYTLPAMSIADNDYLDTFTVAIDAPELTDGVFSGGGGLGSWNAAASRLSASGLTFAQANQMLSAIKFTPGSVRVYPDFTPKLRVTDSNNLYREISFKMHCNDVLHPPTITGPSTVNYDTGKTYSGTGGGSEALQAIFSGVAISVADIDNDNLTVDVVLSGSNAGLGKLILGQVGGTWSAGNWEVIGSNRDHWRITGSPSFINGSFTNITATVYAPGNFDGVLTFTVNDGTGQAVATKVITLAPIRTAPTITAPQYVNYDSANKLFDPGTMSNSSGVLIRPFSGSNLTVADPDNGATLSMTVVLSGIYTGASKFLLGQVGGSFSTPWTQQTANTWQFTGSVAACNTALTALAFTAYKPPVADQTATFGGSVSYPMYATGTQDGFTIDSTADTGFTKNTQCVFGSAIQDPFYEGMITLTVSDGTGTASASASVNILPTGKTTLTTTPASTTQTLILSWNELAVVPMVLDGYMRGTQGTHALLKSFNYQTVPVFSTSNTKVVLGYKFEWIFTAEPKDFATYLKSIKFAPRDATNQAFDIGLRRSSGTTIGTINVNQTGTGNAIPASAVEDFLMIPSTKEMLLKPTLSRTTRTMAPFGVNGQTTIRAGIGMLNPRRNYRMEFMVDPYQTDNGVGGYTITTSPFDGDPGVVASGTTTDTWATVISSRKLPFNGLASLEQLAGLQITLSNPPLAGSDITARVRFVSDDNSVIITTPSTNLNLGNAFAWTAARTGN